tara:strand:+ start:59 stop:358 length:300 start_codon:yes stop_codon:yes gene_type:complete
MLEATITGNLGDKNGELLLCRVPVDKPEMIYNVCRGYEKAYTALTETGLDIYALTHDPILKMWGGEYVVIYVTNLETGERFNYVEVQGGYGLDLIKERA